MACRTSELTPPPAYSGIASCSPMLRLVLSVPRLVVPIVLMLAEFLPKLPTMLSVG